ncbi:MAG: glycosyltransferase family 39 protein [Proteobacteria bacterium]|nr:glycosyltransferase family 39 protein [Pseudomonadota bacterium]
MLKEFATKNYKSFLWILFLAFLSVGARNFEEGLSLDAPLYATISREISQTGELFKLDSRLTEFQPYYADHPHLAFWIQALVFKVFGAADWSARISGHLFYVATLFLLFSWITLLSSEAIATFTIIILWVLAPFANFYSSFYLDPACFFFLCFFLYSLWQSTQKNAKKYWAPLSGISLGLAFMAKGLSILGFGPAAFVVLLSHKKPKKFFITAIVSLIFFAFTIGLYWLSIHLSNAPDFLELYWYRQMTNRFSGSMKWIRLLDTRFWWALIKDSYFLFPLIIFSLSRSNLKNKAIPLCWTLILTYILMYAPAERIGAQYWIYIFPWMAWLISIFVNSKIRINVIACQKYTAFFSILILFFLQYGKISTHRNSKPLESEMISKWSHDFGSSTLYLAQKPFAVDFMNAAPLSWYSNVDVEFVGEEIPTPTRNKSLLLARNLEGSVNYDWINQFKKLGWCQVQSTSNAVLFVSHCL